MVLGFSRGYWVVQGRGREVSSRRKCGSFRKPKGSSKWHRRWGNSRKKAEQRSEVQPDPQRTRIKSSALFLNGLRKEIL